ncbi:A33 protein, partial [Ramphastos sulfuratus]|nr:A33 protein [Ramphastos sulfuratus]
RLSLDPGTAHPRLALSEDLRQVRWAEAWQQPSGGHSPKRFDSSRCVLTREGFRSGKHYWEVLIEGTPPGVAWALGVAKESVGRKGRLKVNPEVGIWALGRCGDLCQALTCPSSSLPLPAPPEAVGILLDCQAGQVHFYDAPRGVLIFSYPPESFRGEKMFP